MFPFYIAKRYIFSKKSHHSINIISGISVMGVMIATAAMVCILSVFNGFEDMVAGLFTAFDPELKVMPADGKYVDSSDPLLQKIKENPEVKEYVEVVEDKAMVIANHRQQVVTIKGVDDSFFRMVDFNSIKLGDGELRLHTMDLQYGIFGVNVLSSLGLTIDFPEPVDVYAPKKGEKINLTNPLNDFNQDELYSPKAAFMVMQAKYDSQYVVTSLAFARHLFDKEGLVTMVELSINDADKIDDVKADLKKLLGEHYKVLDRYEQQADTFKIMEVEKLLSYIFLTFILLIACFNIIGSLSMLIIDKREDIKTLYNLGASNRDISRVFLLEGWLISISGAVLGIIIGVVLCLIQQHYGFLKFGSSAGQFIVDAYPVSVKVLDLVVVFFTVVVIGFLAVWYPVKHFSKKQLKSSE